MSFIRRDGGGIIPEYCKNSSAGFLVTSSGIPTFDSIFGEGIPMGSFILIHEDYPRSTSNYAYTIAKCFTGEGLASNQPTLLIVEGGLNSPVYSSIPSPTAESLSSSETDEKMKIAWRYSHLQKVDVEKPKSNFGHIFDLSSKMDLTNAKLCVYDSKERVVWNKIIREFLQNNSSVNTVCRIILMGFGSPFFSYPDCEDYLNFELINSINSMLWEFKNVVMMVTIPSYTMNSKEVNLISHISSCVIEVNSFSGTPKEYDQAFAEYQGSLRVIKPLASPQSLKIYVPESNFFCFKCKKRRFIIEVFHLPPEFQEEEHSGCSKASDF